MRRTFLNLFCALLFSLPVWAAETNAPADMRQAAENVRVISPQKQAETNAFSKFSSDKAGFLSPTQISGSTQFPKLTGQVVDEAGVLSKKDKVALETLLSSDKNNQIVVAIVKNLRGQEGREYGVDLARHWQLGQKGKDNGVLILMSVDDRYVGIETGYGLEGILTDSVSGRILQHKVLPFLKGKNPQYGAAMMSAATSVMSVITQAKDEVSDEGESGEDLFSLLFLLLIMFMVISGRFPRGGGGGGMFFGGGRGMGGGGFSGGGGSFGGGGAGRRF